MGRGYYKKKTDRQYKERTYSAKSSRANVEITRKIETVLSKTKGYDELQKKKKEKRGRKKKK